MLCDPTTFIAEKDSADYITLQLRDDLKVVLTLKIIIVEI